MQQAAIVAGISLPEITALAFRNKRKLIAALALIPAVAISLLFVLPPVYRAETNLMVKTGREYLAQGDGESGMSAPTSTKQEGINSEIALLTSRPVIEGTINRIGLQNLYPGLLEDPPWFGTVADAAINRFIKDMDVQPVKLSNVITVTMDAGTQEQASHVLDQLIAVYEAKHAEVFAGGRADSYRDSITRLLDEVAGLERQRTAIKLDNRIYDIAQQRAALITQRVDAEGHLRETLDNKTKLEQRVAFLNDTRPKIRSTMQSAATDKSDEKVHANEVLIDLEQLRVAMAARYGAANPDLERVQDQIRALRKGSARLADQVVHRTTSPSPLAQQIDQELVMDRAELAPLGGEAERYGSLLGSLDAELHRLEQADMNLRTTTIRIDSLQENLKDLQQRYNQARTQDEMDRAKLISVVQISKAVAPDKPAKPKNLLFVAGGVFMGILAAGGMLVFSVVTSNIFVTEQSVERLLGLPVLVTVPLLRRTNGRKALGHA
jgi:uncharacterized protein involved in exopolysaccharide biosynthesis